MFYLLLLVLPLNAAAGGGEAWNVEEYEYDFIEAVLLIILVIFALGFEIFWHHVQHDASHAYHYGKMHDAYLSNHEEGGVKKDSHGNLIHTSLSKELVRRMSGEFMNLGFLALTIFIFNQFEFFDFLAEKLKSCGAEGETHRRLGAESDCWHVPRTGSDWLHQAEIVHVKLFLTMVFYFILMSRIVYKSNHRIASWESLWLRRAIARETGDVENMPAEIDLEMQSYNNMRDYLIRDVLLWKNSRKHVFNELVQKLKLRHVPQEDRVQVFREEIDKRLSLASYLSYNVEKGLVDSIEVHVTTWGGILAMFVIFALCNYFGKVQLAHMIPAFVFAGLLYLAFMVVIIKKQKREIQTFVASGNDHELQANIDRAVSSAGTKSLNVVSSTSSISSVDGRRFYQRHMKEEHIMRGLQMVMFMISYALAESLADKHKWKVVPIWTLVSALVYLISVMGMFVAIPPQVLTFLQVVALPPFIVRENAEVLLHVVLDDHSIKQKHSSLLSSVTKTTLSGQRSRQLSGHLNERRCSRETMELADVISECQSVEDLAQVKQLLIERLENGPDWSRQNSPTIVEDPSNTSIDADAKRKAVPSGKVSIAVAEEDKFTI